MLAPWISFLPRRKDWVAVFGKQDGMLHDNTKYFYLQAAPLLAPATRVVMITEREDVVEIISRSSDYEVLRYPTWKAIFFLIRCGSIVVDEAAWHKKMRRFLLVGAKKIQLWHGVGFKRVEIDGWRNETGRSSLFFSSYLFSFRLAAYFVSGRLVRHDALNTTSVFYRDHVFKNAFWAKEFWCFGYPRNDFAQSLAKSGEEIAWENVDKNVRSCLSKWVSENKKLVLIAPTYRDSGAMPMEMEADSLQYMDSFCEKNNIELIFKFHPFETNASKVDGDHFHVCHKDSDIYPLFPYMDALVTDYSSISMDFLLVDKPMLFFIPADDDYTIQDRQLQFDPSTMMPGPVVSSWEGLLKELMHQLEGDSYQNERAQLCKITFDDLPQSQATIKIIDLMRQKKWLS